MKSLRIAAVGLIAAATVACGAGVASDGTPSDPSNVSQQCITDGNKEASLPANDIYKQVGTFTLVNGKVAAVTGESVEYTERAVKSLLFDLEIAADGTGKVTIVHRGGIGEIILGYIVPNEAHPCFSSELTPNNGSTSGPDGGLSGLVYTIFLQHIGDDSF